MDLRILEHRVRVLSLARGGLWLYTHPLLKMLLLPQRSRCPAGRGARRRGGVCARAGVWMGAGSNVSVPGRVLFVAAEFHRAGVAGV
uniref:CASTOR1 N-terminal domain-containing protein n=1 Tax=Varanus komodoensis TaxID=61221 RepID=A0A8D2JA28_VARKO